MTKSKITQTKVTAIENHPSNPRLGNVEAIKSSIETNGFYGAILVQKSTNFIIKGNHTYKAACELGMERIPVIFMDVDDALAKKIMLVDNQTSDLAEYNDDSLFALLDEMNSSEEGLIGSGYDEDSLDKLISTINTKNKSIESVKAEQEEIELSDIEKQNYKDSQEIFIIMTSDDYIEVMGLWEKIIEENDDIHNLRDVVFALNKEWSK